jgi:sec-independent protein translocase protein TatA
MIAATFTLGRSPGPNPFEDIRMSIGVWQVILILVIVLIIFGAGKLPRVMGDVAKGIKNFKSGLADPDKDSASTDGDKKTIDDAATKPDSETKKG